MPLDVNRSQSTRENNWNEIVKLVMWLFEWDSNNEERAKLVHPLLSVEIASAARKAGGGATAARVVIQKWLDDDACPSPIELEGLMLNDFTSYLSSNIKKQRAVEREALHE